MVGAGGRDAKGTSGNNHNFGNNALSESVMASVSAIDAKTALDGAAACFLRQNP